MSEAAHSPMSAREIISELLDLAREALAARESGDDPEDTPEVLELHRTTITAGEALLATL